MSADFTQVQGSDELERSSQLSQQRVCPPCDVPGYEPRRFLGAGAYGEVWVAIDRNTGRQVAIKFYLHRGGLDWSLLAHEVEKMAFLSADRYVVQLLDVGWHAEPPYYVMEYVENGSLAERLAQQGRLPPPEATALVREIAVGLTHSHSKGILHCDLKPANILLDQDGKPRLADFGQSRLSQEQSPALGTLFYMAPEQANSQALPDARWDVYALGAIFYAMLVAHPPHRKERALAEIESAPHLEGRLARYRRLIEQSPSPAEHHHVRGVDKELASIVDRCLAASPAARFPTVQAVLDALDVRQQRRSRRPLMVLGALGPLLLMGVVAVAAWLWFSTSLGRSSEALTQSALKGLEFAAQSAARGAGAELQSRFYDVEEAASDAKLVDALNSLQSDSKPAAVLGALNDPKQTKDHFNELVDQLHREPAKTLLTLLEDRLRFFDDQMLKENKRSASWFVTDAHGIQVAHWYPSDVTLGHNYAWRSYFYGGASDQPKDWRPAADEHLQKTQLSAAFVDNSSGLWVVSISTPVVKKEADGKSQFLGVVGVSFELVGNFINLLDEDRQFPVLVNVRQGTHNGLILQHPLLKKLRKESDEHLDRFVDDKKYRIAPEVITKLKDGMSDYRDPLGRDAEGTDYAQRYLAAEAPIELLSGEGRKARETPCGWVIIVQDPYQPAIGATLHELRSSLLGIGSVALGLIALVILGLWWFVLRMVESPARRLSTSSAVTSADSTLPASGTPRH